MHVINNGTSVITSIILRNRHKHKCDLSKSSSHSGYWACLLSRWVYSRTGSNPVEDDLFLK